MQEYIIREETKIEQIKKPEEERQNIKNIYQDKINIKINIIISRKNKKND